MGLDKAGINEIVAQTFYEDYVLNWKAGNKIPNNLLLKISSTNSNLKVCMQFVCMVDYAYCYALLNVYTSALIILKFKLLYVCNRAAAVPPIASRHLRRWGFLTTPASPYSFSPYYFFALCNSFQGYIKGDNGIMLVRTASLRHLLGKRATSTR